MQAAQVLAGYSLGEADLLRRAMGKKIKSEMDAQRARFVEGCATHNQIPAAKANELFDLIDKFAGYGFNKSHAAAYALVAYQTAWLKAHHRAEFYAASMSFDMAQTDKLGAVRRGHAPRRGRVPAARHQRQPRRISRSRTAAVRYALGRAQGRRRESDGGAGRGARARAGRSPASRISPRASTRGCSTAASSKASPARARSTASSPTGRRCSPRPRRSSPMPRAPHDQRDKRAGRPVRRRIRAEAAPIRLPRDASLDAGPAHGRRARRLRLLFLGPPGRRAARTCSPRTRSGPSPSSPRSGIAEGERVGGDHGRRWSRKRAGATSAKGRRYMMATLERPLGPVRGDGVRRRAVRGARSGGQGRRVRAARRSSSTAAPATMRRGSRSSASSRSTTLAKRTRLQMTVRVADGAIAERVARELAERARRQRRGPLHRAARRRAARRSSSPAAISRSTPSSPRASSASPARAASTSPSRSRRSWRWSASAVTPSRSRRGYEAR